MPVVFAVGDPRPVRASTESNDGISSMARIATRAKMLLGNELFSDAVFAVGPDRETAERIPVHTCLLKMASDNFATMFSVNWKQKDVIHITDTDASAMYSLLRWIYCDELVFEDGKLVDVLQLAQQRFVYSLLTFVTQNVDKIDRNSIWSVLSFANQQGDRELYDKCLSLITAEPVVHFASDDFLHSCVQGLTDILAIDIEMKELQKFQRCLQWAEKECVRQGLSVTPENKRSVMNPFINHFAFPSMSAAEFAGVPCESGVLTAQEQATILRMKHGVELETPFRMKVRPVHPCPRGNRA